jgi:hypothetical protein
MACAVVRARALGAKALTGAFEKEMIVRIEVVDL